MEKLYNNLQSGISNSVTVDYYKTVSDLKIANKINKKYITGNPNPIFYLISFLFFCLSLPYFYNFYDAFFLMHNTLFYTIPRILFAVLFVILSFFFCYIPFYIDAAPTRHYQKYPHKNEPFRLSADCEGIIVANMTYSARIAWNEISDIIEHDDGFFIAWNQSYVFLPARFLTVEQVSSLRNYFKYFCTNKIRSIGKIKMSKIVLPCGEFKMVPLIGEQVYDISGMDTYGQYKKSIHLLFRYSAMKFFLLSLPVTLIMAAILIFACDHLMTALIIIFSSCVGALLIFKYLADIKSRTGYEANKKYNQMQVKLYENSVLFEANGLVKVIEYKNILRIRECGEGILIISRYSDIIRIPDCGEKKDIYNFLNIKTML